MMTRLSARGTNLTSRQGIASHLGGSSVLLAGFLDAHLRWIYPAGDHSHEGVSHDIRVAKMNVNPGGPLEFDDFTPWSPFECVE